MSSFGCHVLGRHGGICVSVRLNLAYVGPLLCLNAVNPKFTLKLFIGTRPTLKAADTHKFCYFCSKTYMLHKTLYSTCTICFFFFF